MAGALKPIRRVVTGNDERGRSKVVWDGPAPNAHETSMGAGRGHTDLWVWSETPAPLAGEADAGDFKYDFPGPTLGGHFRVVQARGRPADYDASRDPDIVPFHAPKVRPAGRAWDRGGNSYFSSSMHKTETVDYAIVLEGERVGVYDEGEAVLHAGDVLIQVGAWHQWRHPREGAVVAFDMIGAKFVDGDAGIAQGRDQTLRASSGMKLPAGVKPARRVVAIDREPGKSAIVVDEPTPDVRFDPARPGFASARMWVTDSTPAKIVLETLHLPHTLEPPRHGSVLRVLTIPPDDAWRSTITEAKVRAYFAAMGSPGACGWSASAPHPYMQKTRTLDLCCVTEGEVVLVLDTQEVRLAAGDVVIQRGTNHAWSNRSGRPARIAVASHEGR
jgi:uncharacterized cupin superfamily protein